MKCVCGKSKDFHLIEKCAICGRSLCVVCKSEGCCKNTPAITVEDEASSMYGMFL